MFVGAPQGMCTEDLEEIEAAFRKVDKARPPSWLLARSVLRRRHPHRPRRASAIPGQHRRVAMEYGPMPVFNVLVSHCRVTMSADVLDSSMGFDQSLCCGTDGRDECRIEFGFYCSP